MSEKPTDINFIIAGDMSPLGAELKVAETAIEATGAAFEAIADEIAAEAKVAAASIKDVGVAAELAGEALVEAAAEGSAGLAELGVEAKAASLGVESLGATAGAVGEILAEAGLEGAASLGVLGAQAEKTAGEMAAVGGATAEAMAMIEAAAKGATGAMSAMGSSALAAGRNIAAAGTQGAEGIGEVTIASQMADAGIKKLGETSSGFGELMAAMGFEAAFVVLEHSILECLTAFAEFEQKLNTLQAVTGGTTEELEALRNKALEMGRDTKFSANQAADGMVRLAKDGFVAAQIIEGIEPVLNLAAAATATVDKAATAAASSMREFGLAASQLGMVSDTMAKAITSSGMDLEDMVQSLKVVGPIAQATGQSFQSVSTFLALLGKDMIKGSIAGNGLQGILARLAAPTKEVGDALSALHLVITDTSGAMLPLNMIIDQLRQKTADMTEVQKTAVLSHIAGRYALKDLIDLVDQAPGAYEAMNDRLTETGAATRIARTQMQGLAGDTTLMTSSVETAEKTLGEQLAPAASAVVDQVKNLADWVSSMPPEVLRLTGALSVAGASFLALSGALAGGAGAYAILSTAAQRSAVSAAAAAAAASEAAAQEAAAMVEISAAAAAEMDRINRAVTASAEVQEANRLEAAAAYGAALRAEAIATTAAVDAALVSTEATAAAAAGGSIVAMLAGFGPQIGVVLALAAAMGVLTESTINNAQEAAARAKAMDEQTEGLARANDKLRDQSRELLQLADRHDELAGKVSRTAAEQDQLDGINDTLIKQYPDLATAIDVTATSHLATLPAVQQEIDRKKQLEDQNYRVLESEVKLATFLFNSAGVDYVSKQQAYQDSLAQGGDVKGAAAFSGASQQAQARREADEAQQNFQERGKRLALAQDALGHEQRRRDPESYLHGGGPTPGTPFEGKARGHKGRHSGIKPTDAHAVADIRTDESTAAKAIEQQAKVDEQIAAHRLQTEKDTNAQVLAETQDLVQRGLMTKQEGLKKEEQLRVQEIQDETAAELAKLDAQIDATQARQAEAQDAADRARAAAAREKNPATRAKDNDFAQQEQGKADDLAMQASTLVDRRVAAEQHGAAQIEKLHADTAKAIAKADQDSAKSAHDAEDKRIQAANEAADAAKKASDDQLGYYDRLQAKADEAAQHELATAQKQFGDRTQPVDFNKVPLEQQIEGYNAAADALDARTARVQADTKKATADIETEWRESLRSIGDELTQLATSPSWDGLMGFVSKLSDPKQLDKVVDTFKKLPTMFSTASASLRDFESGSGTGKDIIGGVGTIAGSVGIAVGAMAAFKSAIDSANASQAKLNQTVTDGAIALQKQQAAASGDAAAVQAAAKADLDNETQKAYDQLRQQILDARGPFGFLQEALPIKFTLQPVDASQDPNGLIAQLQQQYASKQDDLTGSKADLQAAKSQLTQQLATLKAQYERGIIGGQDYATGQQNAYGSEANTLLGITQRVGIDPETLAQVNTELDAATAGFKRMASAASDVKAVTQDIDSAIAEVNAAIKAGQDQVKDSQSKIQAASLQQQQDRVQLNTGGTDDYGNHISIQAEAALKVAENDLAVKKQIADLTAEIAKNEKQAADIETQRAKDVLAIENEGAAVRAKTEFQDKTERIAKVNADAAKQTKDLTDQTAKLQDQITDAKTQQEKTDATIQAQAKDKIDTLNKDLAAQQLILDQQNKLVDATQAVVALNKQNLDLLVKQKALGATLGPTNAAAPLPDAASYASPYTGLTSDGRSSGFTGGELTGKALTDALNQAAAAGIIPSHDTGGVMTTDHVAKVHKGELILNPTHQTNLLWSAALGSLAGGSRNTAREVREAGGNVSQVNNHHWEIHGGNASPQAIADQVMRQVDKRMGAAVRQALGNRGTRR